MGEADREIEEGGGEAAHRPPPLTTRVRRSLVLAAATLALAAGVWIAFKLVRDDGGARQGQGPLLADLTISSRESPVRGPAEEPAEAGFRSGERIYLHFRTDRSGWAFVAMLDAAGTLVPVSSAVRGVVEGSNRLGPFRLDDNAGKESYVVLVSGAEHRREDFERILVEAARLLAESSAPHAEKMAAALAFLRERQGMDARAVTFEHLPR